MYRVFLATDFISVTKQTELDWNNLKPSILTGIMDHFQAGLPVINQSDESNLENNNAEDSETIKQIKDLLETRKLGQGCYGWGGYFILFV